MDSEGVHRVLLARRALDRLGGQAAIVVEQATRWYLAHLLLFMGLVLFVPGLLILASIAAASRPRVGDAARTLTVIGLGGTAAILVAETLAGRLGSVRGEAGAPTKARAGQTLPAG